MSDYHWTPTFCVYKENGYTFFWIHLDPPGLELSSHLIDGLLETAQKTDRSIVSWEFARFPRLKDADYLGFFSDGKEETVFKASIKYCNQK
ncbi:hypothetical protein EVAR_77375_1 [Eumeta japonica]|uniref:Uncharacterized protein n=1 Tax=Eumeta variegata TaxID=151549 RepID=A0A4C1UXV0_EUMVA|nr:hypothetical protein EVAR_77375_1 [Eumeta japonica]